jgi:ubiquinone/menaquinone biosynthesis C-methylase UbiE
VTRPTDSDGEVLTLEKYQAKLQELIDCCERLVESGLAYQAVVLCHELVRFLYPHEPLLGITHEAPLSFLQEHLARLIALGRGTLSTVRGYPAKALGSGAQGSVPQRTSALYTSLWQSLDREAMERESLQLLKNRIPEDILSGRVKGKTVLDMGCGSGRYTLALAAVGASVTGVDFQADSYQQAEKIASERGLSARFQTSNVLSLPFPDASFDFVFCNGVLHHTTDLSRGLDEYCRVMKRGGAGFLYLYGSGGIFWHTRAALRPLFRKIPYELTTAVFAIMGVPGNRFIFCDNWYVPIEQHTTRAQLESWLKQREMEFQKLVSANAIDLDNACSRNVPGAATMWGDGDHRYLVTKPARTAT